MILFTLPRLILWTKKINYSGYNYVNTYLLYVHVLTKDSKKMNSTMVVPFAGPEAWILYS
jgi:hypothetical protein